MNSHPNKQGGGGGGGWLQFVNKVAIGYYNFPVTAFLQSSQKKTNNNMKCNPKPQPSTLTAPLWRSTSAPTSRTENVHNVRSTVVAEKGFRGVECRRRRRRVVQPNRKCHTHREGEGGVVGQRDGAHLSTCVQLRAFKTLGPRPWPAATNDFIYFTV